MKVLNVAEKNDAAKNIAFFLSQGNSTRREGFSVYNKIYEFNCYALGQNCTMSMTSVSGHLMNYEFTGAHRSWQSCNPEELFDAPVVKNVTEDFLNIKKTLEREARQCQALIIWTDCDREGENIGYEVINTCVAVNPRLDVYRAKFSEITSQSIRRAIANLERPNKNISDAVDVRQQLDLRIGAAFTRFQTLRLQRVFPILADHLLSYGSCQFPTLGFVVERYLARENFVGEEFWRLKVTHTVDDLTTEFRWNRDRLFDETIVTALLLRCQERPTAMVEKVDGKPKSKWRPTPLDTTEMEKIASRKLKINAKEALKIAEKLYTKGYISYPRTETNIFPDSINLNSLVELQAGDTRWGNFAQGVLQDGANPRQGKKSDQSHPPIHPIKYANDLSGNDAKLYEFIVRHFLACVSKDAKGHETSVTININGELFTCSGLMIIERNYLDVYPYENWNAKNINNYTQGSTFQPSSIEKVTGSTTAPPLLTEADLIALMEKHGIGTDATHAEHIETIKTRSYVGLQDGVHFEPSAVGMGLVEGYDTMGFAMSKPDYRAELEADLKRICYGVRQPDQVLREQVAKYKSLFRIAKEQVNKIDEAMGKYIQQTANTISEAEDPLIPSGPAVQTVYACQWCKLNMVVKRSNESRRFFLACVGFPACRNAIWLSNKIIDLTVSDRTCPTCGQEVKLLDFKFQPGSMAPYYPNSYTGCLHGCDEDFLQMLGARLNPTPSARTNTTPRNQSQNDSGFSGSDNSYNSRRSTSSNSSRNYNTPNFPSNPSAGPGGNRRPSYSNGYDDGINCTCNVPAVKLTVRKEGPNQGRLFYRCGKNRDEQQCNFFVWDMSGGVGTDAAGTHDDGPRWDNNSRFGGSNAQVHGGGRRGRGGGDSRGRGGGEFRARGSRNSSGPRKCGICHQTGHTRRNCPQNEG
ncbi:DNA topoisomerase [Nesidiocoris tenuis]|uniref:DNA topoisomerase n=1 Tax=Nesidiocoris tenuis TaxID=355587 RepID=A0ABN7AZ20_9HEMI|nr:DNA topoisomerase [Nesidiocoris tenuis]